MNQVSTNIRTAAAPQKLNHVEYIDVNNDGIVEEIAVVKRSEDGTIHYIDIAPLDNIDKARLKRIVTSQHADKYPLWELLAQSKLENGMNALDFFHSNLIKVKRGQGTTSTQFGGGLAGISNTGTAKMPGMEFSNPAEAIPATLA
jgi:molybdenum cofactor biosynthesis enzyme MoaA